MEDIAKQLEFVNNELSKFKSASSSSVNDSQDNVDNNVRAYIKQLKKQKTTLTKKLNACKKTTKKPKIDYQESQAIAFGNFVSRIGKTQLSAHEITQKREKERDEYITNKNNLNAYLEQDSKVVPGLLFLHHNVIKEYGKCPYINTQNDLTPEEIELLRKEWLNLQYDNGGIYYSLYESLYNKKNKIECEQSLSEIENKLIDTYTNNIVVAFDDTQKKLYDTFIRFSEDYMQAKIKSKSIKEKFKTIVSNHNIIVKCSKVDLTEFYNNKYGYNIVVDNNFDITGITTLNEVCMNIELQKKLQDLVREYINMYSQLQSCVKCITNTMNTLTNDLCDFLAGKKIDVLNSSIPKQTGMYFKKWTSLTQEEKKERLEHYCDYFVERYIVFENLADYGTSNKLKVSLKELVIGLFESKKLTCRHFKWNSSIGIIETIKTLKYNNDTKEWNINIETSTVQKKHKSSIRTVFSKDNEKIVNELLLRTILANGKGNTTVEMCINLVKDSLKIRRISNSDKEIIINKFAEISSVVFDDD